MTGFHWGGDFEDVIMRIQVLKCTCNLHYVFVKEAIYYFTSYNSHETINDNLQVKVTRHLHNYDISKQRRHLFNIVIAVMTEYFVF